MKKKITLVTILIVIAAIGIVNARTVESISKSELRQVGQFYVAEKYNEIDGSNVITEVYGNDGETLYRHEVNEETITYTNYSGEKKAFEIIKVIENNRVLDVLVKKDTENRQLVYKGGKIFFCDLDLMGLWKVDIVDNTCVNIQPSINSDYSIDMLFEDKKTYKGLENYLYWVSDLIVDEKGSNIVFVSNRNGYPAVNNLSLWITNESGQSELLVDGSLYGSIKPIMWSKTNKVIFQDENYLTYEINIESKKVDLIFDKPIDIIQLDEDNETLIYNTIINGKIQKDIHIMNVKTGHVVVINMYEGLSLQGNIDWNVDHNKIVFLAKGFDGDIFLKAYNIKNKKITEIDSCRNILVNSGFQPSWIGNSIQYVNNNETYKVQINE